MRSRAIPALLSLALAACGGARGDAAEGPAASVSGGWIFLRFLGGPPREGQITDTLHLDGATRRVRVERNRASVAGPDRTCEAVAPDGEAWRGLAAALADPDLRFALAHPERVPPLPYDAAYFTLRVAGGTPISVSDIAARDADAPRETAAIRRAQAAYLRLHDEVVALPACAGL